MNYLIDALGHQWACKQIGSLVVRMLSDHIIHVQVEKSDRGDSK